jgi:hypothetical protein
MVNMQPPPSPELQAEMISKAANEELEKIRQHALETMRALSKVKDVSPEYAVWSAFVGDIEAEQHKRGLRLVD